MTERNITMENIFIKEELTLRKMKMKMFHFLCKIATDWKD